jgi:hypothetical protein
VAGAATAWGTPDLQGTWTNASLTSLERDDTFKGRPTLSDAEARSSSVPMPFAQFSAADAKPTDPSVQATATSDPGGYNAFWLDPARGSRRSKASTARRSSSSRETAKCRTRRTA